MVECTSYRSDGSGDETVLKYQSGSEAVPIFLGNLKKKKKPSEQRMQQSRQDVICARQRIY